MTRRKTKTAREVAIAALNQFYQDDKYRYIERILDRLMPQTDQRQRATDLVYGCVRNHSAIDMVIAQFADRPPERIQAELLNIIRVAAYELIYCPATAGYAIVNEAVENAGKIVGKKQAGFVNAVLRQITRQIKNRQSPLSEADTKKTLPQTSTTGCQFDTAILPEPLSSLADYLSAAFSLPRWLIEDWLEQFGPENTRQICLASNRRASIYLRPNTLKIGAAELAEKLQQAGFNLEISPKEPMIKLKSPSTITKLPGFAEGLFSVQDPAASLAVRLLQPQADRTILDLCAAPGTKTTQLAELTGDKATIIATDIDGTRLQKVNENTDRLGIKSVTVVDYEKLETAISEFGPFDCVLADVPCSNTGVLSKRGEVRLRINPKAIEKISKTQTGLLNFAAMTVKPGGRICYSTCSIQKQENSHLVEDFLNRHPNFTVESERLTLPSAQDFDHDGGYVAIIAKNTKQKM